jgi:hypothetical protein
MVTKRPTILESWSGKKLGFFQVGSARGAQRVAPPPMVVVRLPPSKMRAESKGVRAGSEAMHSDTRARKQATSTVPLSSVQLCQAEKGKSTSRSQSAVRHVYKSNYDIKDVHAAWKAMNLHTMVRKQSLDGAHPRGRQHREQASRTSRAIHPGPGGPFGIVITSRCRARP